MSDKKFDFSITYLIPVYNDEDVLGETYKRLFPVAEKLSDDYEILFVDDGSKDNSLSVLTTLQNKNDRIEVLKLARNFGQANAIAAGFDYGKKDVFVILDSDLQDRPEDIHKLLDAMVRKNVNMAIARWISREDSFFKVTASRMFHYVTNRITNVHYVPKLGMFRAIRREIIEEVQKYQETTATPISLLYWMGYDFAVVDLKRDSRFAGGSGYTIKKMFQLAFDRIFSFSLFPIRLASLMGIISGISSILLALYYVYQRLVFNNILPGWTSLIVIVLFLFGINFIFLGIIGEYLGRIFLETKKRPKFIVDKILKNNTND